MRTVVTYECEYCGYKSRNQESVRTCEGNHETEPEIRGFMFEKNRRIPTKISMYFPTEDECVSYTRK